LGEEVRPQSAKAKGRRLQQQIASLIKTTFLLSEHDVKSLPMGSQGCDVWLSSPALEKFPCSIECKNVEKLNVRKAFEQAQSNQIKDTIAVLVHSQNRSEVLATVRFSDFIALFATINELKK
jgi:hypothetical protein